MSRIDDIILKHGSTPVSELTHVFPELYDPVAAREYYLRTRKLKGRPRSSSPIPAGRRPPAQVKRLSSRPVPKVPMKKAKVVPKKSTAQRNKETQARVAGLQAKLDQLRQMLALLVKQAKARSGVIEPAKKLTPKQAAEKAASEKKMTPQQKVEAAKKARETYANEKGKTTKLTEQELNEKIAAVADKIRDMQAKIAAAQQKATKRKSSSVGARAKTNK
jgi:hypothetical protein